MPTALKVCSVPGCPNLVPPGTSQCGCRGTDIQRRGTRQQRGYGREHQVRFRREVLRRDPLCTCTHPACHLGAGQCLLPASVADHHPLTKLELRAKGMDEHDPDHGRGLCEGCHNRHTARTSPSGWNAR